jgi:hypothetical protein
MKILNPRHRERREAQLELIRQQVEAGTLVVRKMTPEERAKFPPRRRAKTRPR